MKSISACATILCVFGCLSASSPGAQEIDLSGAWADQETACAKVFVKRGKRIAFSEDADLYGSGFVVEASQVRGRVATCAITSRKQDGAVVHLLTKCSTDIALQNVQFSLRVEEKNKIVRIYPGIPELDRSYFRCPL